MSISGVAVTEREAGRDSQPHVVPVTFWLNLDEDTIDPTRIVSWGMEGGTSGRDFRLNARSVG